MSQAPHTERRDLKCITPRLGYASLVANARRDLKCITPRLGYASLVANARSLQVVLAIRAFALMPICACCQSKRRGVLQRAKQFLSKESAFAYGLALPHYSTTDVEKRKRPLREKTQSNGKAFLAAVSAGRLSAAAAFLSSPWLKTRGIQEKRT